VATTAPAAAVGASMNTGEDRVGARSPGGAPAPGTSNACAT